MTRVSQVLSEAADLLEKPGAWTQGEYARGKSGRPVKRRYAAVCFCALGAIDAAHGETDIGNEVDVEAARFVTSVAVPERVGNLALWNDAPERTQAEVVDAFRRAAALAKAQGR